MGSARWASRGWRIVGGDAHTRDAGGSLRKSLEFTAARLAKPYVYRVPKTHRSQRFFETTRSNFPHGGMLMVSLVWALMSVARPLAGSGERSATRVA